MNTKKTMKEAKFNLPIIKKKNRLENLEIEHILSIELLTLA